MTTATTPATPTKAIDTALTKPVSGIDNLIDRLSGSHTGVEALAIEWGARVLAALLILIVGWMIGRWINDRFSRARHLDPTLRNFLGHFGKYLVLIVSLITVIGLFGIPMASLLAVMGAAGLAIGLALQGTLSNVASGVMILILRPFNVGDYIDYNSGSGIVRVTSLGLFGTEFCTADNVYIYAPNSKVWGGNDIKNYTRNSVRRLELHISIAGAADVGKAISSIAEVWRKDDRILGGEDYTPDIAIDTIAAAAIALSVRFWVKSEPDMWKIHGDVTRLIQEQLVAGGIALG